MKKSVTYKDVKMFIDDYNDWTYKTNALRSMENLISFMLIKGVVDEEKFLESIQYKKDVIKKIGV